MTSDLTLRVSKTSSHAGLAGQANDTLNLEAVASEVLRAIGLLEDLIVVIRADYALGVGESAVVARVRAGSHGSTVVALSGRRERSSGRRSAVVGTRGSRVVRAASDLSKVNARSRLSGALIEAAVESARSGVGVVGGGNALRVGGASSKAVLQAVASSLGKNNVQIDRDTLVCEIEFNEEAHAVNSGSTGG